ncbi:formin-like protein 20 [Cygnus olor]|uniref:formin-like protein 20 n=1 Tax=Cygnus olor TaxID=8869 RepID=UPI001ADE9E35|nr:formin-like protein 20 [Cygnus olor]
MPLRPGRQRRRSPGRPTEGRAGPRRPPPPAPRRPGPRPVPPRLRLCNGLGNFGSAEWTRAASRRGGAGPRGVPHSRAAAAATAPAPLRPPPLPSRAKFAEALRKAALGGAAAGPQPRCPRLRCPPAWPRPTAAAEGPRERLLQAPAQARCTFLSCRRAKSVAFVLRDPSDMLSPHATERTSVNLVSFVFNPSFRKLTGSTISLDRDQAMLVDKN